MLRSPIGENWWGFFHASLYYLMPPKKQVPVMNDIMIDLETLGTTTDSAILSIGAVRFNEEEIDDKGFYRVITIESNQAAKRRINADTLRWWLNQSDKAKAVFNDPAAAALFEALGDLVDYIGVNKDNVRVWGNGADFDIAMLAHAYMQEECDTPWKFYNVRCFRTVKNLSRVQNVPKPVNQGAHNALFDAVAQAQHLQAIWKVLG